MLLNVEMVILILVKNVMMERPIQMQILIHVAPIAHYQFVEMM